MNLDNVFIEPKLSKLTKPILCIEMTGTGNRRALLTDCWRSMTKPKREWSFLRRQESLTLNDYAETHILWKQILNKFLINLFWFHFGPFG